MSDDVEPRPIPYELVQHVHRSKSGKTVMAVSLSIETRALLAQAALDLGCSKLALIRTAISQFLITHEEARRSGQERAFLATDEVVPPVPDLVPVVVSEPAMPLPEPTLEPEPSRKQSRGRKGGSS